MCPSGKHTDLIVMPSLLHHQLNLKLRELHVKVLSKSLVFQSSICEKRTQSKEVSPIQPPLHQNHELRFCDSVQADVWTKSCVSCESEHKFTEGKTNRFGRERWFKRGEKPESRRSFWPLIPLLRKLKEERWASAELGFTSTSPLPPLRGVGGHSQALSTPHKETGKVKEDYKKGDV